MRGLLCLALLLWPLTLSAQTRAVYPGELSLWVEVEETAHTPLAREMVLITIKGIYRRHITREKLVQPDLDGFSWTQLGNDDWREERLNGEKVKTFTRRMAVYPDRAGTLTIGGFTHVLTLTDEGDDWFEHKVVSPPITLEVAPAPPGQDWWFPVKTLRVSDQWSNAPDQLAPGEGVLRVIRIEALGVTPEMIPPMPELTSPSAMIFAHPEKRFVELSPEGPQSYAFWRWTIRPSNDTSTIVEPISFGYFDTVGRTEQTATISAQRVAYGTAVPQSITAQTQPAAATLPGWPMALLAAAVGFAGVLGTVWGRHMQGVAALQRFAPFDPLARQMRRAARQKQATGVRRAAAAMLLRDGPSERRSQLLHHLDRAVFSPQTGSPELMTFVRAYLRRR
ncbi:hypothetical protein So717_40170 [Roseobacter cerasinus]|uniref:Oxygen tolerance n=1 Tax=Roseobacter cerasinus TaxID=2602289 RepID=A0A640VXD0_9RHOB|nr:BatD family protein [Roseobacter cerasinus]GFE52264.1 hypothetical protein So717_40170 [Roseobacter cerasinus]